MCSDDQHRETIQHLNTLAHELKTLSAGRPSLDSMPMISATRPYVVDYRNRKHIFLYSSTTLNLTLEDLGNITIPQNAWTNIGFLEGLRIFATGQTATVPIFVRCTDEVAP